MRSYQEMRNGALLKERTPQAWDSHGVTPCKVFKNTATQPHHDMTKSYPVAYLHSIWRVGGGCPATRFTHMYMIVRRFGRCMYSTFGDKSWGEKAKFSGLVGIVSRPHLPRCLLSQPKATHSLKEGYKPLVLAEILHFLPLVVSF